MEERLQKILARAGFGSRRANEDLIIAGRVKVNGMTAELGRKADPTKDSISVDGQLLSKEQPRKLYIALHKPRGVLSDVDPNDPRPTVMDLVPKLGHLFSVGRLDLDSEGLILLTNDGELANRLTHPRYGHEKEYRVNIGTRPDETQLATWRRGVVLPDGFKTAPAQVEVESTGDHSWLRVILKEGRKRQIREVGSTIGLPVLRIIRVRIGTLELGSLKPKEWRELNLTEVSRLRDSTMGAKTPGTTRSFTGRSERKHIPFRRPGSAGGSASERTRNPSDRFKPSGESDSERKRFPLDRFKSSGGDSSEKRRIPLDRPGSTSGDNPDRRRTSYNRSKPESGDASKERTHFSDRTGPTRGGRSEVRRNPMDRSRPMDGDRSERRRTPFDPSMPSGGESGATRRIPSDRPRPGGGDRSEARRIPSDRPRPEGGESAERRYIPSDRPRPARGGSPVRKSGHGNPRPHSSTSSRTTRPGPRQKRSPR